MGGRPRSARPLASSASAGARRRPSRRPASAPSRHPLQSSHRPLRSDRPATPDDYGLIAARDDDGHAGRRPEVASGTRRVGWRERAEHVAALRARRERAYSAGGVRGPARRARARSSSARSRCWRWSSRRRVIWFCVELFQPFHGSGNGSVTVTIPPHSGTSASRRPARARRRDRLRLLLRAARRARRRSRQDHGRDLPPEARHELRPGAEGADHAAAGREGHQRDDHPRAERALRSTRCFAHRESVAATWRRHVARRCSTRRAYGAPAEHALARGVPVPRHLPAARTDQHRRAGRRPADAVPQAVRDRQPRATPAAST